MSYRKDIGIQICRLFLIRSFSVISNHPIFTYKKRKEKKQREKDMD
jgi:hypothetical protein